MTVFVASASCLFLALSFFLQTAVEGYNVDETKDPILIKKVIRRVSTDEDRVTFIITFNFTTSSDKLPEVQWEQPGHTGAVLDTVLEMAEFVEGGMGVAALRLQGPEVDAMEGTGLTVRLGQLNGQYFEMSLVVNRRNKTNYVISRQARVIPGLDVGYPEGSDCEVTVENTGMMRGDRDSLGLDVDGVWANGTGQLQRGTPPDTLLELLKLDDTPKGWWGEAFRLIFRTSHDAINGFFKLTQQFQTYGNPYDIPVVATIKDMMILKIHKDVLEGPFPDGFINVQLAPGAHGEKNCYVLYFDCHLLCLGTANDIEEITIHKVGDVNDNATSSAVLVQRTHYGARAVLHIRLDTDFGGTYECVVTANGTAKTDTVQLNKRTERFLYLFDDDFN